MNTNELIGVAQSAVDPITDGLHGINETVGSPLWTDVGLFWIGFASAIATFIVIGVNCYTLILSKRQLEKSGQQIEESTRQALLNDRIGTIQTVKRLRIYYGRYRLDLKKIPVEIDSLEDALRLYQNEAYIRSTADRMLAPFRGIGTSELDRFSDLDTLAHRAKVLFNDEEAEPLAAFAQNYATLVAYLESLSFDISTYKKDYTEDKETPESFDYTQLLINELLTELGSTIVKLDTGYNAMDNEAFWDALDKQISIKSAK